MILIASSLCGLLIAFWFTTQYCLTKISHGRLMISISEVHLSCKEEKNVNMSTQGEDMVFKSNNTKKIILWLMITSLH